jgi:formamidopyrimidine-DNA glycosylase
MPELPEVETVRRGLLPALDGRVLTSVEARRPDLRFPLPADFADRLAGRRIVDVGRRAKYLLIRLDGGLTWLVHLGMSGRVSVLDASTAPRPGPHDHVDAVTDAGVLVRFSDPRRFGIMDLADDATLATHPLLADLGPEPLSNAFSGPVLERRLAGRRTPVKAALLDQKVVAGLGNIYVCESLFRAGISPRRLARTIRGRRAERLVAAIREVLAEAIAAGGTTLQFHRRPDGELGYFQHHFAVYARAGEACPQCHCDPAQTGGVRRIVQGGRSTFYCPVRQR